MTKDCKREKMLSEATLDPILMLHKCLYLSSKCWVGFSESEIYQHSEVHNGFLAALLPTAVSLQGNQCAEVQLRVTGMREHRIRVSSACCRGPGPPDVAVTVMI